MASGTLAPPPVTPPPRRSRASGKSALPSEFIDEQIGKTRAYVKSVDIAHGLLVLFTGLVAYLLAMALVDHWLIPGGLGIVGRSVAFVLVVGGAAWHLMRSIAPLVMLRINPLYAAQTIEHCQPSFKNSLMSLLQLRQHRGEVPEAVYDSVERHAASHLAEVPVESTVDRSALVRIGYVMLGVVIAAALYYLISPKDALTSAGRVLMPWSDIAAPTRVTVRDVQPGDDSIVRGQQVEVSAEIAGLRDDETARVVYSSDDGQVIDRELPMFLPEGGFRHLAMLPPADERLQGSVTYRIEAGDARSESFHITVEPTPAIDVESIEYDYPAYTAPILQDGRVDSTGDIRAVEGTQVTIHCLANQPIARASIDFGCDGKHNEPMKVRGDRAMFTFVLAFADRANQVPQHASYQVKFYNRQGRENPTPVQHAIEVLPDLPPEVSLERPAEPLVEVPEDETVEFRATARDADFMLSEVLFRHEGRAGQREPTSSPLLAAEKAPWQGKFDAQWRKTPRELGYRAGDVIRYWVEAVDNKTPIDAANRASTRPATIRVLAPLRPQENQESKDRPKDGDPQAKDKPQDEPQDEPQDNSDNPRNDQNDDKKDDAQDDENAGGDDKKPEEKDTKKDKQDAGDKDGKGEQGKKDKPQDGTAGDNNTGEKSADDKAEGDETQSRDRGEKGGKGADGKAGGKKGERGGDAGDPSGKNDGDSAAKPGAGDDPSQQPPQRNGPADDAEAIKELIKDRQQQARDQAGDGATEKTQPGQGEDSKDATTGQTPSGEKTPGDAAADAKDDTAKDAPAKGEPKSDDPQGAGGPPKADDPNGDGAAKDEDKTGDGAGEQAGNPQAQKDDKPGGKAVPEETQKKPDGAKSGESPGAGRGDPGASGTGRSSKDKKGSPEAGDTNKPDVDDSSNPNVKDKPSENEAPSPAIDKKRSSNPTEGEEGGDRATNSGETGGGGKSKAPGRDSDGTQTSSDSGGDASKEPDKGETGDNAGDDVEADGTTGKSQSKSGDGSAGKPKDAGDKPQTKDGQAGDGDAPPNDDAAADDQNHSGTGGKNPGKGRLDPGSGRAPGDADDATPSPPSDGPEVADPADLAYADKATDLALEHLRDRMNQGDDQELLDKLKWTREDAERFLANWEKVKRDAKTGSGAAEQRLHEELKSLGLRRGTAQFTEGQATKDAQRSLQQGVSVPTPAEFRDRQRAYRVGTGNGSRRGE